jgi:hypothetical protein
MIKTSTGGTIQKTSTGLIHRAAEQGAYSGALAEMGIEAKVFDAPKRGRGRPKKVSQSGNAYDFSAFMSKVIIPKWSGPSRVYTAKAE